MTVPGGTCICPFPLPFAPSTVMVFAAPSTAMVMPVGERGKNTNEVLSAMARTQKCHGRLELQKCGACGGAAILGMSVGVAPV